MPNRLVPYRTVSRALARAVFVFALLLLPSIAACGGDDEPADDAVVAEVGDVEITVEELASYMVSRSYGANRGDAQRALDEMIDIELTRERARERHELTPTESLQVREWREILMLNQFRDDVIYADVEVDEAALHEWYDENVGEQVRARHILIRTTEDMGEAERAAARATADSLLEAAQSGADFAELAEEHSEDPGSAARGGDLGFFDRGDMVTPFANAAYGTETGSIHPNVVESPFGFHVIKVEERRRPAFDEVREDVEAQLAEPMKQEAQNEYIVEAMETSGIEFYENRIDSLIAMVRSDDTDGPPAGQTDQPLVTFIDGEITMGEIWNLYQRLPPANKRQIRQLDQERMIQALSAIAQQRILLARAEEANTVLDSARQRQLDERLDQLYLNAYLEEGLQASGQIPDSVVRQYYEEHEEFYRGQSFEEVEQQIRTVLSSQRMEEARSPDAQREFVSAVADSQAQETDVEKNTERFERVLEVVRAKYEELGRTPGEPPAGAGQQPGRAAPSGVQPAAPPTGAPGQAPSGQSQPRQAPPAATPPGGGGGN